jgi:hypothetical protein
MCSSHAHRPPISDLTQSRRRSGLAVAPWRLSSSWDAVLVPLLLLTIPTRTKARQHAITRLQTGPKSQMNSTIDCSPYGFTYGHGAKSCPQKVNLDRRVRRLGKHSWRSWQRRPGLSIRTRSRVVATTTPAIPMDGSRRIMARPRNSRLTYGLLLTLGVKLRDCRYWPLVLQRVCIAVATESACV